MPVCLCWGLSLPRPCVSLCESLLRLYISENLRAFSACLSAFMYMRDFPNSHSVSRNLSLWGPSLPLLNPWGSPGPQFVLISHPGQWGGAESGGRCWGMGLGNPFHGLSSLPPLPRALPCWALLGTPGEMPACVRNCTSHCGTSVSLAVKWGPFSACCGLWVSVTWASQPTALSQDRWG